MIRINLGSGRHSWPNATNVDVDPRADLISPVGKLEAFKDGEVDEIYAIHLFEHLNRLEIESVIGEWRRVLKPGGKLILELPCLEKIAKMIVEGVEQVELTLFGIFGDTRDASPYMRHQWCYTSKELARIFEGSGFEVKISDPVYHIKARDMRMTGVKK